MQKRVNQLQDQSLQATENMRDRMIVTYAIGGDIITTLDEQQDQINRIVNTLDKMHVEIDKAQDNLIKLKKCCGLCVLPWQRSRRSYKPSPTKGTELFRTPTMTTEPKLRMKEEEGSRTNGYINPITNDDRELAMEKNLQIVGDYLGHVKNMAVDMQSKITNQIDQLENVKTKVDEGNRRIDQATKETRDLL